MQSSHALMKPRMTKIRRDKNINRRYLVFGDMQVPFEFQAAIKSLKKLVNKVKFDEVLCVGDELDFNTISRHSEGKPESYLQTLHEDRNRCRDILYDLKVSVVSRSNHTDRLYKALVKIPGLLQLPELQYPKFMGFDELGIRYAKEPFSIPGTDFVMAHGDEGAISRLPGQTAINLAKRWGKSAIIGHVHRLGFTCHSEAFRGRLERLLMGVEVGHTSDMKKMSYLAIKGYYAQWQAGAVILHVRNGNTTVEMIPFNNDGSFVAMGKSF